MTLPGFKPALLRRRSQLSIARSLASNGSALSPDEAEELEKLVASNPSDLDARIMLLGFYVIRQFQDQEYRRRRSGHILWVIQNVPESAIAFLPYVRLETDPDAYASGRAIWLDHLSKGEVSRELLENAALFLSKFDAKVAHELWNQAISHY